MIGHWLDGSTSVEERTARLAALAGIARRDEHGHPVYPGPDTVRMIREWPIGHR